MYDMLALVAPSQVATDLNILGLLLFVIPMNDMLALVAPPKVITDLVMVRLLSTKTLVLFCRVSCWR